MPAPPVLNRKGGQPFQTTNVRMATGGRRTCSQLDLVDRIRRIILSPLGVLPMVSWLVRWNLRHGKLTARARFGISLKWSWGMKIFRDSLAISGRRTGNTRPFL